jgi:PKD repeat protein
MRSRTRTAPTQPGHRRPGLHPGRRFALVALAVVAVLACGSDVALGNASDTILTVTIYKAGAQPTTESVTSGSLESRLSQCPQYGKPLMQEYGLGGSSEPVELPSTTWSLATVLGCLQPAVQVSDATGGVTVFTQDGAPESGPGSTLSAGDLVAPTTFNDPSESPLVSDLGSSMRYNRPWRGGDDEDFLDQVTESAPIAVAVFEGRQIPVNASASPTTVAQGGTVSFSASASGSGLSYQWSFGGGAPSSTQPNPQVTFASAGVWTVSLLVTDDNGDAGHAQLTETVTASGSTTSTTPTTPGTVTTGPTKSSGTTPDGSPGPPAAPTHKPTRQPTSTRTSPSAGTGNRHKKTAPTSTTQTSTTPSAGAGSGSSGSGASGSARSGSSGAGSTGAGTPTSATTPTSTATAPRRRKAPTSHLAPPAPGAPRLVTGELISDVVPLPESASPLVHAVAASATPATAPALHPPSGPSVVPIIASVLTVLVLLGAGAGRELGGSGRGRRLWRFIHARA